jgi:hypothetical protein
MPPRRRGGGRLGASATQGAGPAAFLRFRVEGVDKTTGEFKRIRREINTRLRDAQQKVGEREVLPDIKARFPRHSDGPVRGLPRGAMADSLYVKRDRVDVFIGSRLKGPLNRALGWIDFGGQRPNDRAERIGPRTIVDTLNAKQPAIREQIVDAVMDEFRREFDVD